MFFGTLRRQLAELIINCSWYFFQVNIIQPENKKRGRPPPRDEEDFQLTCSACKALWSCSKNQKNIRAIRAAGAVPILASLLVRGTDDVILPAILDFTIFSRSQDMTEINLKSSQKAYEMHNSWISAIWWIAELCQIFG